MGLVCDFAINFMVYGLEIIHSIAPFHLLISQITDLQLQDSKKGVRDREASPFDTLLTNLF